MIKQKKAAMEMSVGTLVTIVLLMIVLGLGIILVQKIFGGATDSVDTINNQVMTQINNLFNAENKELVVSLGAQHSAKVKQGTKNFGFVVGFAPEDPTGLRSCTYVITKGTGDKYCSNKQGFSDVTGWIITGTSGVKFPEIQNNIGYDLIKLSVPESIPPCAQRFIITVTCGTKTASTFFDIEVTKKGFL